ncbi:MAG: hypothetical protein ACJAYE_000032 [Candidatus Azotimanducaceae bacterium]|jgi:uncharacterized protein (DUF342 family)
MQEEPLYPDLSLEISHRSLIGCLAQSNKPTFANIEALETAIAEKNLGDLELNRQATSELLQNARHNENFSIELAKLIDAELVLTISADKMSVSAEVVPAKGGARITQQDIEKEMESLSIENSLIDQQALQKLLAGDSPVIIARGRDVVHGTDTEFKEDFFIDQSHSPAVNEKSIADYFDTKQYVTVEPGERVMLRVPASTGTEGVTVLGKVLKAKKGKQLKFKKYSGSEVSPDNEDVLLASISGHPVLEPQGVKVDPTLILPKADLESGDINFDGSVLINGDVLPQVKIVATGDIFVKGTVQNATIEAGKNIVIVGGVISESAPTTAEPPKITTALMAGCDIHAKFLNLTQLTAGENVNIQSYVMNCKMIIGHALLIGEKGGKGALIGGHTDAGHSVTANAIGSSAYVRTEIECGKLHELNNTLISLKLLTTKRIKERNQLKQILKKIKNDPAPVIGDITLNRRRRIVKTVRAINKQLRTLKEELDLATLAAEHAAAAFIQVNRKFYPQVIIKLNDDFYISKEERSSTKISQKNGCLHIE